ncbi:hypothetical protein GCM10022221_73090 [Actinocorallia aurea]
MHFQAERHTPLAPVPGASPPPPGEARLVRDVHDLLGSHLLALTLRGELALRLFGSHPSRAADELREVLALGERALADMREVAAGRPGIPIAEEFARAAPVLAAAGITAHLTGADTPLPPGVERAFSAVVREGVTNVLRHSAATRCDIAVRRDGAQASVTVANDRPRLSDSTSGGSGLGSLALRMAAVGGTLLTRQGRDRGFLLGGSVPLPDAAAPAVLPPLPLHDADRLLRDFVQRSLCAVVRKARHAFSLCPNSPELARAELAELLGIARDTLSRIRSFALRTRSLTLAAESSQASTLLAAEGIEPHVRLGIGALPPRVHSLFSVVLRTGVACVLRHSQVTSCRIAVHGTREDFRLYILNDGVSPPLGAIEDGLVSGLGRRFAALDGSLRAAPRRGGAVAFRAVVPRTE